MQHKASVPLLLLLSLAALTAAAEQPGVARMMAEDKSPASASLKYNDEGEGSWELLGRPDGHERWAAKSQRFRPTLESEQRLHKDWWQFKQQFGRTFSSHKVDSDRKKVFAANMKFIRRHNKLADKGLKTYRLGLTQYTDMTHEEFLATMTGVRRHESQIRRGSIAYISPATEQSLPTTVDWRQKGAVTPVKDQGQCGSCWSFSTTGSLEGQHFRKNGRLLSLSEQQLVDCAGGRYGNQGCNGGLMDNAFKYVRDFGIELESVYPYTASEGTCQYSKAQVVANCTGFVDIPKGSEAKLQEAVANVGPVSVAIDASNPSFQHYNTGVYNEPSCSTTQLDHGVLVVGYGTLSGSDYWLVKNSWNVQWGVQGYIRMARNKHNQCGIATSASYPTV